MISFMLQTPRERGSKLQVTMFQFLRSHLTALALGRLSTTKAHFADGADGHSATRWTSQGCRKNAGLQGIRSHWWYWWERGPFRIWKPPNTPENHLISSNMALGNPWLHLWDAAKQLQWRMSPTYLYFLDRMTQSQSNHLPQREGMRGQLEQQEQWYSSQKSKDPTDNARNRQVNVWMHTRIPRTQTIQAASCLKLMYSKPNISIKPISQ